MKVELIKLMIILSARPMIAKQILYEGRVQGVGFRYSVKQIASGFDVSGTVENRPDGRVELMIQGDPEEVEEMIGEIDQSHLKGFIKEKEVRDITPDPEQKGFSISR